MLEELVIPDDQIEVLRDGSLQVRVATLILRDGVPDDSYAPRYHRYVLHPGDDLEAQPSRVAAIAAAVWTEQ
jgi:hypothetical protein